MLLAFLKFLSKEYLKSFLDGLQSKFKGLNNGNDNHNYSHCIREKLKRAIAQKELTDCLEILESLGIPSDWGVMLLPLIQAELIGSEGE